MDAESWQTKVEELLALQSILQASLLCHVDGSQQTIDDATAEQLLQQGSRGRELSCEATIHCSIPNGGLTVQVPSVSFTFIGVYLCMCLLWLQALSKQIHLLVLQIEALARADGHASSLGGKGSSAASTHVQHLPPISLELHLPHTYPEKEAPGMRHKPSHALSDGCVHFP